MCFRLPYVIFINKKNKKIEEYMYDISLKYSCNLHNCYYFIQIHFKQSFKSRLLNFNEFNLTDEHFSCLSEKRLKQVHLSKN